MQSISFDRLKKLQLPTITTPGGIVANSASDLFVNALHKKGQHTRAIMGVANLPRNFSVGLVSTFTLL